MDLGRWKSNKTRSGSRAGQHNSHLQGLFSAGLLMKDSLEEGNEVVLQIFTMSSRQAWKAACEKQQWVLISESLLKGKRQCPQEQFHVIPIQCKSRLLPKGNRSQITTKDKYR